MISKFRNIAMISFLAVAGIFGVSSAVINKQVEDTPVVEKAEAASYYTVGSTLFFKPSSAWAAAGAAFYAHFYQFGTSNNYDIWFTSPNDMTYNYYFTTVPSGSWDRLEIKRVNPSGGSSPSSHENWGNADGVSYNGNDTYYFSTDSWSTSLSQTTFDTVQSWKIMYGSSSWGGSADFSYKNESDGATFYGMVSMDTTDQWKPHRTIGSGEWYVNSNYVESTSPSVVNGYLKVTSGNGEVLKKDTTDFYVKIYNNSIYAQSGTDLATEFGTSFLSSITCNNGVTPPSTSNWSTVSSTFASLSAAPKYIFKTASAAGSTNLNLAVARYDYIVNKYGTSKYSDFADRKTGGSFTYGLVRDFTPFKLIMDDENNLSTIIIIVSSSVALLSITALSILVIKKRKNKEE